MDRVLFFFVFLFVASGSADTPTCDATHANDKKRHLLRAFTACIEFCTLSRQMSD